MGFNTSKGTTAHYSLTGHDVVAAEVTTKFEHVNTFSGMTITREAIKENDLESDSDVSAPGKITCSDFELSIRSETTGTAYTIWHNAMIAGTDITMLINLPLGAGVEFLANVNITEVGVPTESGGFMHINLKFSVSGVPTKVA